MYEPDADAPRALVTSRLALLCAFHEAGSARSCSVLSFRARMRAARCEPPNCSSMPASTLAWSSPLAKWGDGVLGMQEGMVMRVITKG